MTKLEKDAPDDGPEQIGEIGDSAEPYSWEESNRLIALRLAVKLLSGGVGTIPIAAGQVTAFAGEFLTYLNVKD
jgi:hypothetical protein